MTVRQAVVNGSAQLKAAGIETSNLDASLLLAYILGTTRARVSASGPEPLSENSLCAFLALIERRINGECAAYITGKKEFMGLDFSVNPSVLVPRPDTETLVEAAIELIEKEFHAERGRAEKINILDLCTGSGAVAIALKNEMPELEIYAADISCEALETAKTNAAALLPNSSIHFLHSDLYDAIHAPFSLIISNPPYIPTAEINSLSAEVQNEPRLALDGGETGLEIIERIIRGAPSHLCPGGALLLEADPRQMNTISFLLEKEGFKEIKTYKDLSHSERVIGGIL